MPKPRNKENRALPERWRKKGCRFYYRVPPGLEAHWDGKTEFPLGDDLAQAHRIFSERLHAMPAMAGKLRLFGDVLRRYEAEIIPQNAASTQKAKRRSLARIYAAGLDRNPVDAIEKHHLLAYRDAVARHQGTKYANLDMELISHAMTMAINWGARRDHPLIGKGQWKIPMAPKERYVEDWELAAWASVAAPWLVAWASCALTTPARLSGLLRVTLADLLDSGIKIQPGKAKQTGTKTVIYAWTDERRRAWQAALDARPRTRNGVIIAQHPQAAVFCTRSGTPRIREDGDTSGFHSAWRASMTKALKTTALQQSFTAHDLRAKASSDADSVDRAMMLLTHTNPATTRRVYRRLPEIVR